MYVSGTSLPPEILAKIIEDLISDYKGTGCRLDPVLDGFISRWYLIHLLHVSKLW